MDIETACGIARLARLWLTTLFAILLPQFSAVSEAATCPASTAVPLMRLAGYNANITTHPRLARVAAGQLVEFNPNSLPDRAAFLAGVKSRGALPEWYWVGVNCDRGPDCRALAAAGVGPGSTGTAEWNKTEQRIQDLRHPAVVRRAEREFERALRSAGKAGSHLAFRIDNMHDLDDDRFYDRRHVRSVGELRALTDAWERTVARLRDEGTLPPGLVVGLTAHNNFAFWRAEIEAGRTPPLLLRMENPTQFPREFKAGVEIMQRHSIPFVAVEFRQDHGYRPTKASLEVVTRNVSLMVLMANEDGTPAFGPGPRDVSSGRCRRLAE